MVNITYLDDKPKNVVDYYRQLLTQPGIGEVTAYKMVCDDSRWWIPASIVARDLCISAGLTKLASLLVSQTFVTGSDSKSKNKPLTSIRLPDNTVADCELNPWIIMRQIPRYGLAEADAVARVQNLPLASPDRMAEVAYYALRATLGDWSRSGDVHVSPSDVQRKFRELIAGVPDVLSGAWEFALEDLRKDDRIKLVDILTAKPGMTPRMLERMTTATLYSAEMAIAHRAFDRGAGFELDRVVTRVSDNDAKFGMRDKSGDLDDSQYEAAAMAMQKGFSIVDAPPGYGKTHAIAAITEACLRSNMQVAIGTFMGRAAARVADELRKLGVTPEDVTYGPGTIHSLLMVDSDMETANGLRDPEPVPGIFIVDEASMLSSFLLAMIVRGVPSNWNIILFGDARQLPPIDAGNPYLDLINSGTLPVVRLTTCYRTDQPDIQSGLASIRNGIMPESADDFQVIVTERDNASATIVNTIRALSESADCAPLDILVCAPQMGSIRKVDIIKVDDINRELKKAFNPNGWRNSGGKWWLPSPGDRVMARDPRGGKSSLSANAAHKAPDGTQRAYNGELGILLEVDYKNNSAFIAWDSNKDLPMVYTLDEVNSNERIVDLAYAVTVHKVQGAEAPAVMFVVDANCTSACLTNAHAYTACSRGKRKVAVVTTIARPFNRTGFASAVGRPLKSRQTLLSHFLSKNSE
jgi:exodeoxyribonuclease V alpha subunit